MVVLLGGKNDIVIFVLQVKRRKTWTTKRRVETKAVVKSDIDDFIDNQYPGIVQLLFCNTDINRY